MIAQKCKVFYLFNMMRRLLIAIAAPAMLVSTLAQAQDISGDPARGRSLMEEMKCPQCHGQDGKGRLKTPGVPRIDGQYETYLVNQLQNFRDGRRPHKFMEVYAGRLDGQTIRDLAAFYACQGSEQPLLPDPERCTPVR
ncbi:MAG: cytochrome c [Pseudomonadota bacterium]|jgi:cytochrome c553|nr:cytochrome c [Pseudomonadota bacterium]